MGINKHVKILVILMCIYLLKDPFMYMITGSVENIISNNGEFSK